MTALAVGVAVSGTAVFAYLSDRSIERPPNYNTFRPPAKGVSYVDPIFGTTIKRVSDARNTPDAAKGSGPLEFITAEYSTMTPFNLDSTRFILQHFGYTGLYDGQGNFIRNLPFEVSSGSEPRWSRQDPNLLYYHTQNTLKTYNIATNVMTTLHTFSEYTAVDGRGESDICFDGDHFVLTGDARYVFVYTISTNTKGPVYDAGAPDLFDQLYITPNDNILIGWYLDGAGRKHGVEMFDKNMNFLKQVAPAIGHMDVTRDVNGDEVMVWANAADPAATCNNAAVKVRLSDLKQTCLISLDWAMASHISAPDNSGWVFMETYTPSDPSPTTGVWPVYTNELLQVKLDGTEVRRLAHHRSRPFDTYYYTPRVSTNRAGNKIVFSSNYDIQADGGLTPNDYVDTYLIDLTGAAAPPPPPSPSPSPSPTPAPSPSPTPAPSPTPTPAPSPAPGGGSHFEENSPAVTYTGTWSANVSGMHSGGRAVLSAEVGARATFTFTGTGVTWRGYRDEWSGIARVYLDGVLKGNVDTFLSPAKAQQALYGVSGLAAGSHTLVVEVTGQVGPSAKAPWIWVDSFDVIASPAPPPPPPTVTRVEQTAPAVAYTNTWRTHTSTIHSGGSAAFSATTGAQATLTFSGTGVTWLAYRDQWSGMADVFVDGVLKQRVDTFAPTGIARNPIYQIKGLPAGTHTLAIQVTGVKSAAASGAWIWVDAFDVTQ
jgi:hypothetical protein